MYIHNSDGTVDFVSSAKSALKVVSEETVEKSPDIYVGVIQNERHAEADRIEKIKEELNLVGVLTPEKLQKYGSKKKKSKPIKFKNFKTKKNKKLERQKFLDSLSKEQKEKFLEEEKRLQIILQQNKKKKKAAQIDKNKKTKVRYGKSGRKRPMNRYIRNAIELQRNAIEDDGTPVTFI